MSQPLHQFQFEQMWSPWRYIHYLGGSFSRSTPFHWSLGVPFLAPALWNGWIARYCLSRRYSSEKRSPNLQLSYACVHRIWQLPRLYMNSLQVESNDEPVSRYGHLTADKPSPFVSQTIWPWLTSWLLGDRALGTDHAKLTSFRW